MKKILFILAAAVYSLVGCDSVQEDYNNSGNITVDELKAKTSVSLDKSADGQNGNVLTCSTSAPVNARWLVDGKEIQLGNYAWKKLKIGEHTVKVEALCPDGTLLSADYPINVQVITNKLTKYVIYGKAEGEDEMIGVEGAPFKPGAWDAAAMRFSANEGKFTDIEGNQNSLPFLTDEIYWGFKTLIFDISDATPDCAGRIMNGWWSARYDGDKDVKFTNGLWELPLTEAIAKDCASKSSGGEAKDLDLMVTSGSCQINSIYYEE